MGNWTYSIGIVSIPAPALWLLVSSAKAANLAAVHALGCWVFCLLFA